jgi:hypothetical protein
MNSEDDIDMLAEDSEDDIDMLAEELDNVLIYDPAKEYNILTYSQIYSLEELNLAREAVIKASIKRYNRYIKYIPFNEDSQSKYIKSIIIQFLSCQKNENKIDAIREIDRLLLAYIDKL